MADLNELKKQVEEIIGKESADKIDSACTMAAEISDQLKKLECVSKDKLNKYNAECKDIWLKVNEVKKEMAKKHPTEDECKGLIVTLRNCAGEGKRGCSGCILAGKPGTECIETLMRDAALAIERLGKDKSSENDG